MDPHGRVVIITGASSGIGAAAARAFAEAGANVVLAARSAEKLQTLAAGLPGRPLVLPTDVSDEGQARSLVERTLAERGRVDILVNNAGVGLAGPIAALNPRDLEQALAVDLLGPLYTTQAAVPAMRRQGRGQIINVSSVVGLQALPYLGGYAAAKAALDRLTEALRMELRGSGIAVTLLRPGTTSTGFSTRRLGSGKERRRVSPRGVPPEVVALALLRAARREPRLAYVSLADRLRVALAILFPGLTQWALSRAFSWEEK
ncbi:MAG: SDR family NAD(P)-dependent oxidoreductase [Chloroflexaceae bacterium]|jgi:short-subunit dehydrogenase|nr:SDR family NAD(P)-dependent oxidoreductase [Chloroflexaceae bacterium]